ncbi:amidohydrolase family protein [Nannocystis sp. SCPEA4]|uniref:amidohydrolase family protein n=1 Tax=Nannocystis sp. SCPEA4 TaxID=2996787 RepID=UPI00226E751C|nr:amidohydrolase family protein [Nannocystis sp. SCPEA4]MCY1053883.1 amidohydrolase family protein [Nannocystis sp. SCPEA4]
MRRFVVVLIALGSCADDELGVVFAGERMPVIDMHLHPGDWDSIPPETKEFLASRFPFPIDLRPDKAAMGVLSPAGILEEMDRAGVSVGALFAIYAPRTVGVAANEDVIADVAHDPRRFYGLASLRVDRWNEDGAEQLAALRAALMAPGMVGIKLAHAHQQFRMDDPRYFPIYALAAELKKPVYLHTGTSPFPGTAQEPAYTDPAYLEPAIAAHPGATFILGHLGYDFERHELGGLTACIDLATRYDNVFLEPSALGSKGSDPTGENLRAAMARLREAGLVDRVIYGSDGPQSPGFVAEYLERTVAAMAAADYTAEEARAVLSGNFARVFAVPAPEL